MWDALTEIDQDTKGWQSREVEGTGGHSSVLLDRRLNPWQESRDAGEDGIVLLAAALSKPFADDPNKNVGTFLICYREWPTTVTLGYDCKIYKKVWFMIYLTGPSTSSTPRTHNRVFVETFRLVHSLDTVAALDDGNYSLLQLVCGGLLDSSVSPA